SARCRPCAPGGGSRRAPARRLGAFRVRHCAEVPALSFPFVVWRDPIGRQSPGHQPHRRGRDGLTKWPLVATLPDMRTVGLKTLKNKLSEYVRAAASGETVIITDRGRVVA